MLAADSEAFMSEVQQDSLAALRVICIHGTAGHPCIHWFPWLKEQLERQGFEVLIPWFPTPEGQHLDTWLATFRAEVGELRKTDTLVGHSVGACFILRLLESTTDPVFAAHLVAGFHTPLPDPGLTSLLHSFVYEGFNWRKVCSGARVIRLYSGDSDPFVPLETSLALGQALHVPVSIYHAGGHLNSDSGFVEFPDLLRSICCSA